MSIQQITELHFLIVDDMAAIRAMVHECLRSMGIEHIHQAADGQIALELIKTQKVDMIICDWDMPNLTGLEVLKHLRENEETQNMPFLMLTANNNKLRMNEAMEAGATEYLAKPFQLEELQYRLVKMTRKL